MEKNWKKEIAYAKKKKMYKYKKRDDMCPVSPLLYLFIYFFFFFCKQTLCSLMEDFQSYFLLIMLWRPKNSHQISLPYIGMSQQDTFAQSWHMGQKN